MKFRIAALTAMMVLLFAAAAQAATYNVTTTNDDSPPNPADCPANATADGCSLREAVHAANDTPDDDTINVPAGNYLLTNTAGEQTGDNNADLDILSVEQGDDESAGNLTIIGNSARTTTIRSQAATDDEYSRIFDIEGGRSYDPDGGGPAPCTDYPGTATDLFNLYITEGFERDEGGAIRVDDVDTNCAFADVPEFDAKLDIFDSAITRSFAGGDNYGGGIYNEGETTLTRVLVAGNLGGYSGGGIWNQDTLTAVNSTIAANATNADGGGIGTAPYDYETDETGATTDLTNVTIAFNEAGSDDEQGRGGGLTRECTNCGTIAVQLKNTIIAHNEAEKAGDNCFGPQVIHSKGNNLENDDSCLLSGSGDKSNTDAGLLPRGNNGGQTDTYALASGSAAIDAGANEGCPSEDQRGVARPQGAACDIGAYEFVPPPPTQPAPPPPPTVITNTVQVPTAFPRVRPRALSLRVRKTRPTRRSLRLRSTGRVLLPAGLTPAQACTFGIVAVQVKANGKTVSTRITRLNSRCRYSSAVTFNQMRRIRGRILTVRARFFGNDRLRERFSRKRSAGRA